MYSLHALVDCSCPESFEILSEALSATGVRPIRMAGVEGLARLINRVKVSAVFLNWDGARAHTGVRIVRESKSNTNVPIAMLTGSPAASVIADGAREGVNFFLAKPVQLPHIDRTLAQMLAYMNDERRSYQRVPLAMPVVCEWNDGAELDARSVNISASGMLLSIDRRPEIGSQIVVCFGTGELDSEFTITAEVVRTDPSERVGVRYLWESLAQHEQLKDCLEQKLAELDTVGMTDDHQSS